jgi:hypothetical protein
MLEQEKNMRSLMRKRAALLAVAPLLALAAACDRSPLEPGIHSMGRVEIIDLEAAGQPVAATWTPAEGWTGTLPDISLGTNQRVALGARIFDAAGTQRPLSTTGSYSVRWRLAPGATAGVVVADDSRGPRFLGDHVHIFGAAPGTTEIQFILWHIDHEDGATTPIAIGVVS